MGAIVSTSNEGEILEDDEDEPPLEEDQRRKVKFWRVVVLFSSVWFLIRALANLS